MIKKFCDICGKEADNEMPVEIEGRSSSLYARIKRFQRGKEVEADLCVPCFEKFTLTFQS